MEDENYNYNYNYKYDEMNNGLGEENYEDELIKYDHQKDNNIIGKENPNVISDYMDEQLYENDGEEIYHVGNREEVWDNYQEMENLPFKERGNQFYDRNIIPMRKGKIFLQGNEEEKQARYNNSGIINRKEFGNLVPENQYQINNYDKEEQEKIKKFNKNNKININKKIENKIIKKISNIQKIKIKTDGYKDIQNNIFTQNNHTNLIPQTSIPSNSISNIKNTEIQSPRNNDIPISPSSQKKFQKETSKISYFSIKSTDKSNYQFHSSYYSKKNLPPSSLNKNSNLSTIKLNTSGSSYLLNKNKSPITSKTSIPHPKTPTQNNYSDIFSINKQQQNLNIIKIKNKKTNENEKKIESQNSFLSIPNRNIQTPQCPTNVFIINNLKYYIRCPNCNYLLNNITLEKNDLNKKNINVKSDRNKRDIKQIIYKKEMEEKKKKEKKEREERELKERKEREERLKKQKEETEKKEKLKKEQKEKQKIEYKRIQIEKEKEREIKRKSEEEKNKEKLRDKKDGQELKKNDFEIYKQNKTEFVVGNKDKDMCNNIKNYYIYENGHTVFKPVIKSPNSSRILNKIAFSPSYNSKKIKTLILGDNIGIYESHG